MALARAGSPAAAVPLLGKALADDDAAVRAEARAGPLAMGPGSRRRKMRWRGPRRHEPARARVGGALPCASAGGRPPAVVDAASVLRALLDSAREHGDPEMPDARLVLCLASFGPSATPQLTEALENPDFRVRWHAAAALMQLRQGAKDAAPALRRAMDDPEWAVRNAAGRALEDVVDKPAVPLLAEALTDPSAETRYHVARALARVGPGAVAAVPVLEAALRDEDWEVRDGIGVALCQSAWPRAPPPPGLHRARGARGPPRPRAAGAGQRGLGPGRHRGIRATAVAAPALTPCATTTARRASGGGGLAARRARAVRGEHGARLPRLTRREGPWSRPSCSR